MRFKCRRRYIQVTAERDNTETSHSDSELGQCQSFHSHERLATRFAQRYNLPPMEWLTDPAVWTGLLTLTVLEIVLGIDNIVFISILSEKLPENQREKARKGGLALALATRLGLLCTISWLAGLTRPLFDVFGHGFSAKDIVLVSGGLFLIGKSVHEIHGSLESADHGHHAPSAAGILVVIVQIALFDIVFSLDSVITAVGLVDHLWVMIAAIVLAMGMMLFSVGTVSRFVNRHPTLKMLALSFLLLIGVMLVAESFGQHIPKGYVYFAMAFSVFVEMLNIKIRGSQPVKLKEKYEPAAES